MIPTLAQGTNRKATSRPSGTCPARPLEIVPSEQPSIEKWKGTWRRDSEAEIVLKSDSDEVTVSGNATWGGSDPRRVKRGAVNTGELQGTFKPRGQVPLARSR